MNFSYNVKILCTWKLRSFFKLKKYIYILIFHFYSRDSSDDEFLLEASQRYEISQDKPTSDSPLSQFGENVGVNSPKIPRMDYNGSLGDSYPSCGQEDRSCEPVHFQTATDMPVDTPYQPVCEPVSSTDEEPDVPSTNTSTRFAKPKSDSDILKLQTRQMPINSRRKVNWAVRLFEEWRQNRNATIKKEGCANKSIIPRTATELRHDELSFALSAFVAEIKKADGTDYPPNTLFEIIMCIQTHINVTGRRAVKFMADSNYVTLKLAINNVMQERAKAGLGLQRRQAQVITTEQEEIMWAKGVLGSDNPRQLVNTVISHWFTLWFKKRKPSQKHLFTTNNFWQGQCGEVRPIQWRHQQNK